MGLGQIGIWQERKEARAAYPSDHPLNCIMDMSRESTNGGPESPPNISLESLRIPEPRDSFFGYLEEKSQQHVGVDLIVTDER